MAAAHVIHVEVTGKDRPNFKMREAAAPEVWSSTLKKLETTAARNYDMSRGTLGWAPRGLVTEYPYR